MAGLSHVTNGSSSGMMSTAGLELPYEFPRPSFGMKLIGRETNVTFVKRKDANQLHLFIIFGKHDGYIGNINHLW